MIKEESIFNGINFFYSSWMSRSMRMRETSDSASNNAANPDGAPKDSNLNVCNVHLIPSLTLLVERSLTFHSVPTLRVLDQSS